MNLRLICPECRIELNQKDSGLLCKKCQVEYPRINGNIISFPISDDNKEIYDDLYQNEWVGQNIPRNLLFQILLFIRENIAMSTRRERFFRRHLHKGNSLILDIGCGYGKELFTTYGTVVGLDIALKPLYGAAKIYDLCVHSDISTIPFPEGYFDYIVSSDFLGHINMEQKDALYKEMKRILKPGGKMIHMIETDANNWHFRFAHRYPDLFKKYFVDEMGHIGLELPHKAIERLERNGFGLLEVKKLYGDIWRIQEYKQRFDNEYKEKSGLINSMVLISRVLSINILTQEIINTILNAILNIIDRFTPLDNAQGILVFCKKITQEN